ncbi:MAG TPA: DnaA/Hda family protein, partial [Ktedonobacterales bacterium]|nr:DnaA/Hda family protein [Ktedonobacterales bacterium]
MNPGFLWQSALERIRQRVSPGAYSTWFRDTCGLALEGRQLTVGVANSFACEHLGQRFADLARVALSETLGAPAHVTFVVHHPVRVERPPAQPSAPAPHRDTPAIAPAAPRADAATRPTADVAPTAPSPLRPPRASRPTRGAQIAHSGAATYAPYPAPTTPPPMRQTSPTTPDSAHTPNPPTNSSPFGASTGSGKYDAPAPRNDARWMAQPPLLRLHEAPTSAHNANDAHDARNAHDRAQPPQAHITGGPRRAPTTPRLLELPPASLHTAYAAPQHELRPGYRFETFVVGTANRLAFAAAQEVVRAPGAIYNPLVIYGGPGLGKTHLLHAIGHRAVANGRSVVYVTAEQFTNELIEAIQRRATEAFRRRYRAVDVLLMDDAQWIAGREATEEEFFHTFNWLHEANKQIVLTSDCPPQAMRRLH